MLFALFMSLSYLRVVDADRRQDSPRSEHFEPHAERWLRADDLFTVSVRFRIGLQWNLGGFDTYRSLRLHPARPSVIPAADSILYAELDNSMTPLPKTRQGRVLTQWSLPPANSLVRICWHSLLCRGRQDFAASSEWIVYLPG